MTPSVLQAGLPWDWESFPQLLDVLDKRLGINAAVYIGHSAMRRWAMGEAASEREATPAEIEKMATLVREAMRAGAAGFSSSQSPTHVDQLGRPVPSRKATFDEVKALATAAGEGGAGSIAFLASTAVQGYDATDRQFLIELAHVSGLPVVVQGMGYRPGAKDKWDDQVRFLADARARGAAIYSMLRTQPFMRPFNWRRGTSLFDGVFHWRDLAALPPEGRLAWLKDPGKRAELRWALDHPNTDSAKGSTLPPPAMSALFVDKSGSDPGAVGKSLAQLAKERGVHPADVFCEITVADKGDTQYIYNSESPAWIEANLEAQRNLHMIVGTGDGGAHADRDDGAEWSTYFLRAWCLDRQAYTLEDAVRRITHLPAAICGIERRGLIARGYHADVMMFDPTRLALGRKQLVRDMPGGEERWQVLPEGVVRVLVNGEVIVEQGRLTGARPGRVLRIGNAT
jgi:N-acyl-D-aspartate/D-glutamate deacylase